MCRDCYDVELPEEQPWAVFYSENKESILKLVIVPATISIASFTIFTLLKG